MTRANVRKLLIYWKTLADSDWQAVAQLFKSRSYAQCLFFLHLSLEKQIKAMIVKVTQDHAPYSHDLGYLVGKTGLDCPQQIVDRLRVIGAFNMESRYPDENLTFYKRATKSYSKHWIAEGKLVREWLARKYDEM